MLAALPRAAALAAGALAAAALAALAAPYASPRLRARLLEPALLLGDGARCGARGGAGARRGLRELSRRVRAAGGVACPWGALLAAGPAGPGGPGGPAGEGCEPLVRAEPFLVDRLAERSADYAARVLRGGVYAAASLPAGPLLTWLSVARLRALAGALGYGGGRGGGYLLLLERRGVTLVLEPALEGCGGAVE